MIIEVRRIRTQSESIDGHLYIEGQKICDTVENTYKAVKPGTYAITLVRCPLYERKLPHIGRDRLYCDQCPPQEDANMNTHVPVRCTMLKPGNGVHQRTDGSIRIGTRIVPGCLCRPKPAFDILYDRIRKNLERGNKVTLNIIEL